VINTIGQNLIRAVTFALFAAAGVAASAAPNLTPYQPSGWSGKIVASKTTGTNTDSSSFSSSDNIYVDWSVLNNGTTGTSATFQTQLFVDGQLRATWNTPPPLNSFYYSYVSDYSLGQLPAGSHTLRIKTDSSGAIAETSESDNEYSRTITVNGSLPNLTPYQPAAWSNIIVVSRTTGTSTDSSSLTTSDNLYLDWTVLNAGGSATTSTFQTQLLVDGSVRATWSTPPPLNASYYAYVSDYPLGQLSAGSHTLTIRTDTTGAVAESNEGDNQYSRTINVTGAAPNLYPFQPSAWTNKIVVSRTAGTSTDSATLTTADNLYVDWAVLNGGGSATATTFQTQLFVDGTLRATWTTASPLAVGYYSYVPDYSLGQLSAGSHTLRIKTDSGNAIAESSETDNEYSRTIDIAASVTLPNLLPFRPSAWSAPIVVSKSTGTSVDSSGLTSADPLYLDWCVLNSSATPVSTSFQTQLFIDGTLKATWNVAAGLAANSYIYVPDYSLGTLSAGPHTLRIRADTGGTVAESNESDNETVKTITIASRSIFTGILGGSSSDLNDDPSGNVSIWRNQQIPDYINKAGACGTTACVPTNTDDLIRIANSQLGGIFSIGLYLTSVTGVSSLNTPGNSDVPKSYIVQEYKPHDRVYVVGFSAGGGDAQNVLEKLDSLGIPVKVSGHIDSVEYFGDDASIPANTVRALGFYQTQSALIVRGESNLVANNPAVTTVSNTKIADPAGPADPKTDDYAYHRNMDNDSRVWVPLKDSITAAQQAASVVATDVASRHDGCGDCSEAAPRTLAEQVVRLQHALLEPVDGDELYEIREEMASSIHDASALRQLMFAHAMAAGNPRLHENLTAVLLKVDATGLVDDLAGVAAETTDYGVFIAAVHSIAREHSVAGVKSVLGLVAHNHVDATPAHVVDAVLSAYAERDTTSDAAWMLQWIKSESLDDRQLETMAKMTAKNAQSDATTRELLEQIARRVRQPESK